MFARRSFRGLVSAFALVLGCGTTARSVRTQTDATVLPSSLIACERQVPLPFGRPVVSTTVVGEDLLRGSCVRGTSAECGFLLRVPVRGDVRLSLESSDFDGALALFDTRRPAAELACADDTPMSDTHHARLESTLEAGEYLVVVEGAAGEAGQFSLFAEFDPLPDVASVCADARVLEPGVSLRGSTRGAANQFGASCAGGADGPDQVHAFEVATSSRVRIRQRSEHDGALHLRSHCEDPESELACNDDVSESGRSIVTAELVSGRYYVISDSFSRAQSGDYVLSLEEAPIPEARGPEAACAAARAKPLGLGEREIDTFYGTSEFSGSCGGEAAPEQLLTLDLAEETTVLVELQDAEFNAVLYLRVECEDDRSELNCWRAPRVDQDQHEESSRVFAATIGPGRYTLGVDGQAERDMGAASLRVRYVAMSVQPGAP